MKKDSKKAATHGGFGSRRAGYSSAGCSPEVPASASSAESIISQLVNPGSPSTVNQKTDTLGTEISLDTISRLIEAAVPSSSSRNRLKTGVTFAPNDSIRRAQQCGDQPILLTNDRDVLFAGSSKK